MSQAKQRINEARAALGRVESQRRQVTVKEAEIERAAATLRQAQADLAFAELQLQHTEVRAPADGVVAKKSVEVGQVVQMGQPLLAIVPLHEVWVLANFKETQLGRVRPGMPAEVEIDTFPGQVFHGTVDSLSAGTGARFSLLPPENATGNWVKVVQRVPVKIRLDPRGVRQSPHAPGRHVRVRRHPREVGGARPAEAATPDAGPISPARKWAITLTVMVVAFMQILDTSVTNVVLPHLQGSLSAGLDEVSWVITSYLAANAIIIPATGWLAGVLGRKRFFLICCVLFTVSSLLSGAAPDLTILIIARIFQGIGGGPIIPLSQAILWEIFPLEQRGLAMAVWGVGFILGPILGPTVGGYIADKWSWRWIFYINLPVGLLGFFMASAFLFDPPYLRKPARVDWLGLVLMVLGFGCLQLVLDRGEREDWFDSSLIVALSVVAGARARRLPDPRADGQAIPSWTSPCSPTATSPRGHAHHRDRPRHVLEHAAGRRCSRRSCSATTRWTSGLVLAPGGLGNMFSLFCAGGS